jgi:hypothetical protein
MATWETVPMTSSTSGWQPVEEANKTSAAPTVAEINAQAGKDVWEALPSSVKTSVSDVASAVQAGWEALPEPVKQASRSTGNFLLDVIEPLSRPLQATLMTGKGLFNPEVDKQIKETGNPLLLFSDENIKRAQQSGIKGLLGQEKASTQELLSDDFRRNNPVKSALFGFVGDMLADPLKAETVAMGINSIKSVAKTVPGSVSVPGKLADNELFRMLNFNTGDVAKAQDLFNKYRFLRDKASMESVKNAKILDNEIKLLSKAMKVEPDVLKAKIVQDIETGKLSDDAVGELEAKIVQRNRENLENQRATGVEVGDLGETFMTHVLTKEADELLNGKSNFFGLRPSSKTPSGLSRDIPGTVMEINAKNLGGTKKFFIDDPAVIMGVADYRAATAMAGRKFLDDATELGVRADAAPANYKTIPEIPDMKFPPEVAERLNRSYKTLMNDDKMNKFLNMYDGAQNWWKMWSLGARPAYHAKNVVGNLWNSYLGGLENPVRFGEAAVFQVKLAKNNLDGEMLGRPVKELYEAMATRGVIGEGQYGGDIARTLEKQLGFNQSTGLRRAAEVTAGTDNPILRAGFKVGQELEDNARVALFFDQLKKGKSYDEAGRHVQKYLFDYGDLSPFERGIAKRAMPFYTWSRKNIPLQLESLVMHPDKVNKINIAKDNIQAQAEVPFEDQVPSYIQEAMPIYLPGSAKGQVTAMGLANLVPIADLQVFTKYFNTEDAPDIIEKGKLSNTASTVMSSVSPLLKAPVELVTNYDFFRKKAITEFKGQTADMLGITMPVWLAKLLSNLVLLNEVDRTNPGGIFGERTVDKVTGNVTTKQSIFGQERESRVDLPEEQRQAQYFTGIRVYDLILDDIEGQKSNKLNQDIKALQGFITRAGQKEKTRELEAAENALETFQNKLEELEIRKEERRKRQR